MLIKFVDSIWILPHFQSNKSNSKWLNDLYCCVVWCPDDGRGDLRERFRRKSKNGGAWLVAKTSKNLVSYNGKRKQVTQQQPLQDWYTIDVQSILNKQLKYFTFNEWMMCCYNNYHANMRRNEMSIIFLIMSDNYI